MMPPRNTWNSYFRTSRHERWTWVAEGAFYTESHGAALLRVPAECELLTIFGRQMPQDYEQRWRKPSR